MHFTYLANTFIQRKLPWLPLNYQNYLNFQLSDHKHSRITHRTTCTEEAVLTLWVTSNNNSLLETERRAQKPYPGCNAVCQPALTASGWGLSDIPRMPSAVMYPNLRLFSLQNSSDFLTTGWAVYIYGLMTLREQAKLNKHSAINTGCPNHVRFCLIWTRVYHFTQRL